MTQDAHLSTPLLSSLSRLNGHENGHQKEVEQEKKGPAWLETKQGSCFYGMGLGRLEQPTSRLSGSRSTPLLRASCSRHPVNAEPLAQPALPPGPSRATCSLQLTPQLTPERRGEQNLQLFSG